MRTYSVRYQDYCKKFFHPDTYFDLTEDKQESAKEHFQRRKHQSYRNNWGGGVEEIGVGRLGREGVQGWEQR